MAVNYARAIQIAKRLGLTTFTDFDYSKDAFMLRGRRQGQVVYIEDDCLSGKAFSTVVDVVEILNSIEAKISYVNLDGPFKVLAPFTTNQMISINDYQLRGPFHSYTCKNNSRHLLMAYANGLSCDFCSYSQDWVWDWTANGHWRKM